MTPKSRSRSKNATSGRDLYSTQFLENYQRELHNKSSNIMNLSEDIKKLLEAVKKNRNDVSTTSGILADTVKSPTNSKSFDQQRKATKTVFAATQRIL